MPNLTNARLHRGEIVALAVGGEETQAGKIITLQVIRAGEFTDMTGKDFALSAQAIDAYIANSNALIAQEQVPIELGHPDDPAAPAAAWYRKFFKKVIDGVEWVCAEVELTALGAQSLADQLYKYFSANLWLDTQTICGGGFVNRPAVSGQQPVGSLAQAYLQPKINGGNAMPNANPKRNPFQALVEDTLKRLSAQIAKLEMSQEDAASKIRKALEKKYADPMADEYANWRNVPYVVATYSDRIIVSKDEKCFALPYTFNADGDCELGEPVEVEITWTPKTNAEPNATATMASAPSSAPNPVALSATPYQGGDNPMSQPNPIPATPPPATNPEASASVAPTIPATNPLPVTPIDPALSVEEQIRLAREQATQAALEQQKAFEAQLAAARKEAWERAQAEMTRKQNVAALSQKLTSGRFQLPFTPEELDEVLLKLSDADRAIIAPVLEKIHDKGLVELGERGTAAHGRGVKELPAYAKSHLQTFLASKGTLQEFFAANIELGKPEDYDLYEFEKK